MRFIIYFFISMGLMVGTNRAAIAQPLNASEQKIQQYASSSQEAQLNLLKQLVNINSGTTNIKGVKAVGYILQQQLQQLGFTTAWFNEPANMQRAGSLVATHQGQQPSTILLIGHLDTVAKASNHSPQFRREKDTAYGPGVIDDKGGDVVIIYALKALQAAGVLQNLTITVVLTGDEEDSGKPASISRKPLIKAAENSYFALDFEPAIDLNTATVARRGILQWIIETTGNGIHSADIFNKTAGYGAIFELTRILDTMLQTLSQEPHITFSPGIILGGTQLTYDANTSSGTSYGKDNVIAAHAKAIGDLRYLTIEQKAQTQKIIYDIIKQNLPGTTANVSFIDGIPPMPLTENNMSLLAAYSNISQALGQGNVTAIDPDTRGAADISYIASMTKANLSGLGPSGAGMHSDAESLNIPSLTIQTERAAILLYRLAAMTQGKI